MQKVVGSNPISRSTEKAPLRRGFSFAYVEAFADEVDEHGRRLVVRTATTPKGGGYGGGAVPVRQPRVNDKRIDPATGERQRFSSAIPPAWAGKSPRVAEVLPLLYLHGLSSSDFGPNDPRNQQAVTLTPHDTLIHRP
jgi:hypothetical protein